MPAVLRVFQICDMMKNGGQVGFISEQRVPYIHRGNQWVGYDNPDSLKEKVRILSLSLSLMGGIRKPRQS